MQTFEMPSCCGAEPIWQNLAKSTSFCGTRRTDKEPGLFAEALSKSLPKISPRTAVLQGETFHELRRGLANTTAA